MKGRDLIIYILKNGLENEEIFEDGFLGFPTAEEVAVQLGVGLATIQVLAQINKLDAIVFDGVTYILPGSLNQLEESKEVENA